MKTNRKEYTVMIGEKLKECLDKQKQSIREVCYGAIKPSYYEAGEVLAEKIKKSDIL